MAQVVGVGGVFFRCRDPEALGAWYARWLGMDAHPSYGVSFRPSQMPEHGYTVWGPFREDTRYFDPSSKAYMFNLVVDDLDGALAQARDGGAELVGGVEEYEYGRFGWFIDPEGNKVELWQPSGPS